MTPDAALNPTDESNLQPPSTAGMTTKVVKGSLWTLAGQVAPLVVSFVATPFVIRLLGSEGYGVFVLIGLLPAYLAFADLGMGIASTKFASEAYARGSHGSEAKIVRTAGLTALCASVPLALSLILLSGELTRFLNVPGHLQAEASLGIKFAAVTFIFGLLNGILNTPQLTRLRMDLNTMVTVGFRIAGLIATPVILYLGGGIAAAVFGLMVASILTFIGHLMVSRTLLPDLFGWTIESSLVRPMLRYGLALASASIAGMLLINLEKVVLAKTTSIKALAYYSVAFTLAMMTTTLSASMTQSLIPAFSQLFGPEKRQQLNDLFSRAVRVNIIVMLPALAVLFVIARPFFTIWAGEDFGRESTLPFYILLIGVAFAINNYAPVSLLMATGRTDLIAKLNWAELVPYLALIAVMTYQFGAIGAAVAWTVRVVTDTALIFWMTRRKVGISYQLVGLNWQTLIMLATTLLPIIAVALLLDLYLAVLFLPFFLTAYALVAWKTFLASEERSWLMGKLSMLTGRQL